jgi:nicotinate-nucleotide adenylyltransferase
VRLGILGGTFDPPHVGHLLVASDAFERLALDRLVFIPAAVQPLKVGQITGSAEQRLAMARLAFEPDSRFEIDSVEIDREGLSYTVDTLTGLVRREPAAERFLLVGADVLASFAKWREPRRILELARLVVLARGDDGSVVQGKGGEGGVSIHDADGPILGAGAAYEPVLLQTRRIDVSSTEIRERVRRGLSIRGFVSDTVAEFISSHGLYR